MKTTPLAPCPGCGGLFPETDGPVHRYMDSSPGCSAAAGAVFARQYQDLAIYGDVYRLSVDAYAVQHPGERSRQAVQSVGVHLVRLCLAFEHGLPPDKANDAMLAAAKRKREFVWLAPPASMGTVTVADAPSEGLPEAFERWVRDWAQSAWEVWGAHHPVVRGWLPA